MTRKQLKTRSD